MSALPQDRYLDRELAWLDFNNRVLDLARDSTRIPLLERAKFLAIFASNLDEFFMVRIAGLRRRIQAGVAVPGNTGTRPSVLHLNLLRRTAELVAEQSRLFHDEIHPQLREEGIEVLTWEELSEDEVAQMRTLFSDRIFPVLTPLAVDPSHPFPYISGLSLNLAVQLRNPATGTTQFARVKVPTNLHRFIQLAQGRFLPLEQVIIQHLDQLFAGMEVLGHACFRVTRNEDIEVEEDDAENLLDALERELLRRRVGRPPVRLEVDASIDQQLLKTLVEELSVAPDEVFRIPAPLDLTALFALSLVPREDLSYPNFLPTTHTDLAEVETSSPADLFKALSQRDVLVHHPYDSFATSVQRLLEQAAADPHVLAIKQTLYRTSGDSPVVDALIEAAQAGKEVLAVVEIKARFDEENNITWARRMEKAGVHVVYGMLGLKTHCKVTLVVREEAQGLRRYAHIGTGNYHPKTARRYEDMGLLTADPVITDDLARLFNHLSGMTQQTQYRRLMVAPHGIRDQLVAAIETEIANHREGKPSGIRIKVNSIVDETVIDALYRASQAGVNVDVLVRGICTIRPGVPGLSDNIRVRSILGRFLEHSRIYWFEAAGKLNVGIGSADLMHRNLDRRVEAIVALSSPEHKQQIKQLFDLAFDDGTVRWELVDSTWSAHTTDADGQPLLDLQEELVRRTRQRRRR